MIFHYNHNNQTKHIHTMKKKPKKTKIPSANAIRDLKVVKKGGEILGVGFNFGPHFSVVVKGGDEPSIGLVATHHGVTLRAAELNDELEKAIELLRKKFPKGLID